MSYVLRISFKTRYVCIQCQLKKKTQHCIMLICVSMNNHFRP